MLQLNKSLTTVYKKRGIENIYFHGRKIFDLFERNLAEGRIKRWN